MDRRLELHAILKTIVASVYFQPPTNVEMVYPCIVYELDGARVKFAGNGPYNRVKRYQVTVIDRNPDSTIPDAVAALPMCEMVRAYVADQLHHYVFNLYF